MTARNAPCHCGSGRKYKYCHGAVENPVPNAHSILRRSQTALQSGRINDALEIASTAPDSVEKFRLLVYGLISRKGKQDLDHALDLTARWHELQPRNPEPLRRRLEILLYQQQPDLAGEALKKWNQLEPEAPDPEYFSAVLLQLRGDEIKAIAAYARAVQLQRARSGQHGLGESTLRVASAMQFYETAAGNYPGSPGKNEEGMFSSQGALKLLEGALNEWQSSAEAEQASTEITTRHADAWYNLGCAALAGFTGDDRRLDLFRHAIDLNPAHTPARFNLAFAGNYSCTLSGGEIYAAHSETGNWVSEHIVRVSPFTGSTRRNAEKIRLGYLSADFRQHSVAHFILPVLQHHDRSRFEVFIYHNHHIEDSITARARNYADSFRNISQLTDAQARQIILDDGVDVLVDLNGLTQNHRMELLASRAAPVQMSWIGYPNTTGLKNVDFRLVDPVTDPDGMTDELNTESLIRLPAPFLVFEPPEALPDVAEPPFEKNGHITFGSFNALPKLNPPLLHSWARILHRVPDSKLLIKNVGMDYRHPRQLVSEILVQQGIESSRLLFAGKTENQSSHLDFYGNVDISLDTFPYNGTTTSCDSLIMGVPVISWQGGEHRSRVGLSLLSAVGLESLVASDENSLAEIATALASDTDRLKDLRLTLRSRLLRSALCDAPRLTASLEKELLHIWDTKRAEPETT